MAGKETHTQILKRIEAKVCNGLHCENHDQISTAVTEFSVIVPELSKSIKETNKLLAKVAERLTIMETQRKTERGVLVAIATIIGAVAGWFGKHI